MNELLLDYLPLAIFIAVAVGMAGGLLIVPFVIAYKAPDPEKLSAYECGFNAFDDARHRLPAIYPVWLFAADGGLASARTSDPLPTGSAPISSRISRANGTSARSVRLAYVGASKTDVGSAVRTGIPRQVASSVPAIVRKRSARLGCPPPLPSNHLDPL
jgi:hypothetical protein